MVANTELSVYLTLGLRFVKGNNVKVVSFLVHNTITILGIAIFRYKAEIHMECS